MTMRGNPRAAQFPFVDNPATVILHPSYLTPTTTWWSYDNILIGGLEINSLTSMLEGKQHFDRIGYSPILIPRSWAKREFHLVLEYESKNTDCNFQFKIYYGCGDPSELHLQESKFKKGKTGSKKRVTFFLDEKYIYRNELFRVTVEVARKTPGPVYIYGAWLEVGID